jgi:hypothetical protein
MDVVAQAHYVYDHRYVLDASLSGSAASILEPGHRWGIFPSVGAAWIMSEEAALKSDWLNLLKLRASYGPDVLIMVLTFILMCMVQGEVIISEKIRQASVV